MWRLGKPGNTARMSVAPQHTSYTTGAFHGGTVTPYFDPRGRVSSAKKDDSVDPTLTIEAVEVTAVSATPSQAETPTPTPAADATTPEAAENAVKKDAQPSKKGTKKKKKAAAAAELQIAA